VLIIRFPWHDAFSGLWKSEVGLKEWIATYIIKKPWLRTKVSSMENGTLGTFYKKPSSDESII
jgi:hypothetical protein